MAGSVSRFLCSGAYEQPSWLFDPGLDQSGQALIEASALTADVMRRGATVMHGAVIVRHGAAELKAEHVELSEDRNVATLEGDVQLRAPDLLMIGQRGFARLNSRESELEEASFVLHEAGIRGSAERIARTDRVIDISHGGFTRCEPGNNLWSIDGRSIQLRYDEGYGTARNVLIRVKGKPVLYAPYIRFPISDARQTGFLMPSFGYDGESGSDLSVPYYANLATDYDLTYVPRTLWRRGLLHEAQGRYLLRSGENEINGGYLADDDLFDRELERNGVSTDADRWYVNFRHTGSWTPRLSTTVRFNKVSDEDYLQDLSGEIDSTGSVRGSSDPASRRSAALDRFGEVAYRQGPWKLGVRFQGFQNLDVDASKNYERLPEVKLEFSRPLKGVQFDFSGEITRFDKDDNRELRGASATVGDRVALDAKATYPFQRTWGYVKPTLLARHRAYDLEDQPTTSPDSPSATVPGISIDSGLFFERGLEFAGLALQQTLEPRLFMLWVDHADQSDFPDFDAVSLTPSFRQLFREDRFAGKDRMGDAEQISVALTSRFLDDLSGAERMRGSIGQIYYFSDRKILLPGEPVGIDPKDHSSALFSEVQLNLGNGVRVMSALEWDPDDSETHRGRFDISYNPDDRHIVNIGYNFTKAEQRTRNRPDNLEESDLSFVWPIRSRWNLIGRWNYDWELNRTIESLIGIEFDDCCWKSRLVVRRYLRELRFLQGNEVIISKDRNQAESAILFEFQFKGLGTLGRRLDSILEESIRGYDRREE